MDNLHGNLRGIIEHLDYIQNLGIDVLYMTPIFKSDRPACRRGMCWDEEYQDKEMFEWYKQLLRVRKTHACIVEGEVIETCGKM